MQLISLYDLVSDFITDFMLSSSNQTEIFGEISVSFPPLTYRYRYDGGGP